MVLLVTKLVIALLVGIGLWLMSFLVDRYVRGHTVDKMVAAFKTMELDTTLGQVTCALVGTWGAISEEIVYRLWLLLLPPYLVWPALLASSLVFAWRHYAEFKRPVFFFICGVVFGVLLLYVGWWAGFVAHFVFNIGSTIHAARLLRRHNVSFLRFSDDR